MELAPATAEVYVRHAFAQMLQVAERLGDQKVNERPLGPGTNAVAALIIHCCELSDFWLGHMALGRPTSRDRDSEFSQTASVAELQQLVDRALIRTVDDIRSLEAGYGRDKGGQFLQDGDASDAAVVLHVLKEFFQHLGHMEIAADALFTA